MKNSGVKIKTDLQRKNRKKQKQRTKVRKLLFFVVDYCRFIFLSLYFVVENGASVPEEQRYAPYSCKRYQRINYPADGRSLASEEP